MKNLKAAALSTMVGIFVLTSCEKKVVVQNPNEQTEIISPAKTPLANVVANTAEQDLPKSVRAFLNDFYPNIQISKYEVKTKTSGKQYEVKLNNGVEVEFDQEENCGEVIKITCVPEMIKG